jgi:heterodisulfide reductase subunit C
MIINDILSGNTSRLLDSEEIWRCFWCANCYRVCPVDINYPFLMMQLRYLALENGYGLKYVNPINKYAFRAFDEGLCFVPGAHGVERIKKLRSSINVVPWPEVSEKAKKEFREIFELTGAYDWMKDIESKQEKELRMSFAQGGITNEL